MKTQGGGLPCVSPDRDPVVSRRKTALNRPDLEPKTATAAAEIHVGKCTRSTPAERERERRKKEKEERKKGKKKEERKKMKNEKGEKRKQERMKREKEKKMGKKENGR